MRFSVLQNLAAEDVALSLPARYKGAPLPLHLGSGNYTLLVVETGSKVVCSKLMERIRRLATLGVAKAPLRFFYQPGPSGFSFPFRRRGM